MTDPIRTALEELVKFLDAPPSFRCPHCSFHPTSSNDFCDAHRPGRQKEVLAAARAALATDQAEPKSAVLIDAATWNEFIAEYDKYDNGDPRVPFSQLRLSLATVIGSATHVGLPLTRSMTLTGAQLRDAFEFAAPDSGDSEDQLEVTIAWLPARKSTEGDDMPEGYYAWLTDYPEEGCIELGGATDEDQS